MSAPTTPPPATTTRRATSSTCRSTQRMSAAPPLLLSPIARRLVLCGWRGWRGEEADASNGAGEGIIRRRSAAACTKSRFIYIFWWREVSVKVHLALFRRINFSSTLNRKTRGASRDCRGVPVASMARDCRGEWLEKLWASSWTRVWASSWMRAWATGALVLGDGCAGALVLGDALLIWC